jgi:hypothetical protein
MGGVRVDWENCKSTLALMENAWIAHLERRHQTQGG